MKRYGLIGHPIGHSKSPALFHAAYGGRYGYDLIEGADFEASWARFMAEYDGINVTAPFKEQAFDKADIRSAEVDAVGATNLLVKTSAGVEAHNSDFLGVRMIIRELEEETKRQGQKPLCSVLVVGCGGAAKAAAAAALMEEMDVTIANRSVAKAEEFAARLELYALLGPCSAGGHVRACGLENMPSADLVVYCLPLAVPGIDGMHPRYFIEANYRDPAYSGNFFDDTTVYISGGRWLVAQAVTGYGLLTGETPDSAAISKIL